MAEGRISSAKTSLVVRFFDRIVAHWRKHNPLHSVAELKILVIAGVSLTTILLGIRQFGGLEPLELTAYDQMLRLRPVPPLDTRILIVGITEADLRSQQRWPLSDQVMADMLSQLQRHQPKVIGLDLVRNFPNDPGHQAFVRELQRPNVITIRTLGNAPDEAVKSLPEAPPKQVGFSDIIVDTDGVVRRSLVFAADDQQTATSFAMQIAMTYLSSQGSVTAANELVLGRQIFRPLQANSGGYQTTDSRGYQLLLNYHRPDTPARIVPLSAVLQGRVEPAWAKDHIVVIGATAPTLKDSFYTPYSAMLQGNPRMAGVVVHAQMISQILTAAQGGRSLFWFWPESLEILWIVGWGMAGGILAWWAQRPLWLVVGGTGLLAALFGLSYGLLVNGGWVPVAAPALAAIAIGSFTVAQQMQYARQQQQIGLKLLGQQTSPEVAAALWNARDRLLQSGVLTGQTLTATILFLDICRFSTISEQRPTEEVMSWLNEFMRSMTHAVHTHQGIVNKFTGDGLMAVFGVPIPRTTTAEIAADAQHAVACALAMGDRLRTLNQDWGYRNLPVVKMRVGIFTGPVMAGSLGGQMRLEYAVIGDSVNIASRLEGCEKERQSQPCRILIARETLDYLQNQFRVESWGHLQLRGRQTSVEVYEVLGYRDLSP